MKRTKETSVSEIVEDDNYSDFYMKIILKSIALIIFKAANRRVSYYEKFHFIGFAIPFDTIFFFTKARF